MNEVSYFARRIVSVVALTMLVLLGGPHLATPSPPGSIRKPKNCCAA